MWPVLNLQKLMEALFRSQALFINRKNDQKNVLLPLRVIWRNSLPLLQKKRRRNTYSCKKLFIVPSGLFNNYFKVNSVTSKDPLFSNGLSRSVKPWQPLELQLGRKENHHLIQQCQNGSSEWVWWSQYHATNDKLNISYFSYGYCPSGLFFLDCLQGEAAYSCKFSLSSRPSLGVGWRGRGEISPRNTLYSGDFKSCFH